MARPITTSYSEEERAVVIERVLTGLAAGEALYRILREDPNMPSDVTFWKWAWADEALMNKVARARELGIEARLAQCDAIADGDDIEPLDGLQGAELARAMARQDPKRAKLRVETRIKMAQMLKPKTYGPKLDLTTDGNALNKPAPDAADRAASLLGEVARRTGVAPRHIALDDKTKDLLS